MSVAIAGGPLRSATRFAVASALAEGGGTVRLQIRGESMLPLLRAPMTLEVRALVRAARVGDVIVFRSGDDWVAHRVVARDGVRYTTSGDHCPETTDTVDAADVLGLVVAVRIGAGASSRRVDTPLHRARGFAYARGRTLRLFVRAIAGALRRVGS